MGGKVLERADRDEAQANQVGTLLQAMKELAGPLQSHCGSLGGAHPPVVSPRQLRQQR
jgi:hypothetical protein